MKNTVIRATPDHRGFWSIFFIPCPHELQVQPSKRPELHLRSDRKIKAV